jgi:hypothetical protein
MYLREAVQPFCAEQAVVWVYPEGDRPVHEMGGQSVAAGQMVVGRGVAGDVGEEVACLPDLTFECTPQVHLNEKCQQSRIWIERPDPQE